jgi:hypothetical protein
LVLGIEGGRRGKEGDGEGGEREEEGRRGKKREGEKRELIAVRE